MPLSQSNTVWKLWLECARAIPSQLGRKTYIFNVMISLECWELLWKGWRRLLCVDVPLRLAFALSWLFKDFWALCHHWDSSILVTFLSVSVFSGTTYGNSFPRGGRATAIWGYMVKMDSIKAAISFELLFERRISLWCSAPHLRAENGTDELP